jgi:two-component system OmpR family response regulator
VPAHGARRLLIRAGDHQTFRAAVAGGAPPRLAFRPRMQAGRGRHAGGALIKDGKPMADAVQPRDGAGVSQGSGGRAAAPWATAGRSVPTSPEAGPVGAGTTGGRAVAAARTAYSPGPVSRSIAIVEDEPALRANVADALVRHGYDVATYASRPEALEAFRTRLPDLALIDIGLGDDIDGGFELTRALRALSPGVPIIVLSARDSEFDIVAGLRLGADDYVSKDTSLPHLAARIAALFRRSDLAGQPPASEDVVVRGALALDLRRLTARWRDRPVDLTLTEFWMVHALARFPGHVKDRDSLMREARVVVDDSTITSHVKRIRRKFATVDPGFDRIASVYGMGYRWLAEDAR